MSQVQRALEGSFGQRQRFLVARQLAQIDYLVGLIGDVSREIEERLRPLAEDSKRLDTIHGLRPPR